MSIAGINGYNYSNYYTGTKRNTANANGMNSGLLSNVSSTSSNITLHMSGTEDSGNALTAIGFNITRQLRYESVECRMKMILPIYTGEQVNGFTI